MAAERGNQYYKLALGALGRLRQLKQPRSFKRSSSTMLRGVRKTPSFPRKRLDEKVQWMPMATKNLLKHASNRSRSAVLSPCMVCVPTSA